MTVTLELPPDAEAGLRERAAKHGQSVTDYLLTLAEFEDDLDLFLSAEDAATIDAATIEEGISEFQSGDRGISLEKFDGRMSEILARHKSEKPDRT